MELFAVRSPARLAAEGAWRRIEREGIKIADLERCDDEGPGGTRLGGLLKLYVPISGGPASGSPFGFVLAPGRDATGVYLTLVAFGERHPRPGVRSVYERAHKRLRGRYPDER